MRIILKDIDPDDWILAIRAAKYLKERFQKDAWLAYGEYPNAKEFSPDGPVCHLCEHLQPSKSE